MADLTVTVDGSDAGIRSMMDRLKADIRAKSGEMSRDFQAAFKDADRDATAALRKINAEYDKVRNSSTSTVADIARAQQRWSADTARLTADVTGAYGRIAGGATGLVARITTMGTTAQAAGVNMGILGQAIGALATPIGLVGIALGALTLGANKGIDAVVANMKEVRELMAVSGMSATEADNLADTFQLLGKDIGSLTSSLFKMSAEIDAGGEAFQNLGINVRDASGRLKSEGALFLEVRDRISDIGTASARTAVAVDIFGRGARSLANIFSMSRQEFAKWQETGGKMSEWTEEQQKAAEEYTRQMTQLSMQFGAFWLAVGSPIVTAGASFLSWVNSAILGIRGLDKAAQESESAWASFWRAVTNDNIGQFERSIAAAKTTAELLKEHRAGERSAGQGTVDVDPLGKAGRESLKQLKLQLDMVQATEAHRPIVALTAAMNDMMAKAKTWGSTAEKEFKAVFDALMGEAKVKEAQVLQARAFEMLSQRAREAAAVETREVNEQLAARVLTEEQAALRLADIKIAPILEEAESLRRSIKTYEEGSDEKYAAEKQLAAKEGELLDAQSAARALAASQYVAIEKREIELREMQREGAHARAMTELEGAFQAQIALAQAAAKPELEVAREVYENQVALAAERTALAEEGIQARQRELNRLLMGDDAYYKAKAKLEEDSKNNEAKGKKEATDAKLALDLAYARSEAGILRETSVVQIDEMNARLKRIDALMEKHQDNVALLEELSTAKYKTESEKRVLIARDATLARINVFLDEREAIVRQLEDALDAEQRFADQAIRMAQAVARANGEASEFLAASLAGALTRGRDTFSSLAKFAEDAAQAIQRGFSDFFFEVFEGRLENLKKLALDFGASLKRAVADFFASQITNEIGNFFGTLFNVGNAGGAQLSQAAQTTARALTAQLVPAVEAAAIAFNNATRAAGGAGVNLQPLPAGAGGGGTGGFIDTFIGMGSKLADSWSSISSNFSAGADFLSGIGNVAFGQAGTAGGLAAGLEGGELALELGTGATSGLMGSGGSFGGLSGLTTVGSTTSQVLGGIGTAFQIGMIAMNDNLTDVGKAVESAIAAAGFVLSLYFGPIATLAATAVNWILDLTGIFEKASEAWLKFPEHLEATLKMEQTALQGLQNNLTASESLLDIAKAVDTFKKEIEAGGVAGFASLPGNGPFYAPGIPGATGTEHEGGISIDFGPHIQQINDVIDRALAAFREGLVEKMPAAVEDVLPAELFQKFVDGPVAALERRFDALIKSGMTLDEATKELEAIEAEAAALGQLAALYSQLGEQAALLSNDFGELLAGGLLKIRNAVRAATSAIEDARSRLLEATTGPEQVAAAQDLQEAIIARYDLEKKLVEEIEGKIENMLSTGGQAFLQTSAVVTSLAAATGDYGPLVKLVDFLESVGDASSSTSIRLWAVASALQAITTAAPAAIAGIGPSTAEALASAVGAVFGAASPSMGALGDLFAKAQAAGDRNGMQAVLSAASGAISALAASAVAGVERWAQATIAAGQKAAADYKAAIDRQLAIEIARAEAAGQALVDAAQKAADEAVAANELEIESLERQQQIIQENIDLSREWAQVAESLARYIVELRLGTQAPPDPMGQFLLAQELFDQANVAFALNATPEGAAKVQQSASDLLAAAQLIYTRPSPEYRELFDRVVGQLESVQATAAAFVTPEEQAVAELQGIANRVAELNASSEDIQENARLQIEGINANTQATIDGFNAQAAALHAEVDAMLASYVAATQDAARAQIDGINAGLSVVMQDIAKRQAELLGQMISEQIALLDAVTGGVPKEDFMVIKAAETAGLLRDVRDTLYAALSGQPIPPVQQAAAGGRFLTDGMVYGHAGEEIRPARLVALEERAPGVVVNVSVDARGFQGDAGAFIERVKRELRPVIESAVAGSLRGGEGDRIVREKARAVRRKSR